jgi:hypothetical protein
MACIIARAAMFTRFEMWMIVTLGLIIPGISILLLLRM